MTKPLVSVIMSVYNGSQFIWDSLSSIYNQTFKDYELILIDDGSVDNTFHLLKRFKRFVEFQDGNSSNIKIFRSSCNKKLPFRRNQAISESKGELITIQDADDISLENRIEKEVEFLENNKDVFCVGSYAIDINAKGEEIGRKTYPPPFTKDIINIITSRDKYFLNPIIDPSTMFRKKDFVEIGGYTLRENIHTVLDYDLWLRALLEDKMICNIQEFLIKYRKHEKSITNSKKNEMIKAHMIVWRDFVNKYQK